MLIVRITGEAQYVHRTAALDSCVATTHLHHFYLTGNADSHHPIYPRPIHRRFRRLAQISFHAVTNS
jgi:hypothetical protein